MTPGTEMPGYVLYRAPERVFADAQWAHITDWAAELDPHYDTAERMLGVATNPGGTLHDEVLQQVAEDLGGRLHLRVDPVRGVLRRARCPGRGPLLRR